MSLNYNEFVMKFILSCAVALKQLDRLTGKENMSTFQSLAMRSFRTTRFNHYEGVLLMYSYLQI
jgi:hypothetical protein